ncbi:Nicotinamidase [Trypanosoma rangeli SC58]|uniref:nicotinamidase n=1 Tax=Trypanosoma rangeli SC58 TaxID=429131 RepID=A0A061J417_TRYRA|nr:Nicotinamidase [Trypanosoma rangeli SC58]ESL08047.1 Nicotinamidase [Trypanosoma rangeli SC58]
MQQTWKEKCAEALTRGMISGPAAMMPRINVSPIHDALLVVDMQNDFVCPDGALSVPAAMEVIPVINHISHTYDFRAVVATKDWHPPNHCSFRSPEGPGGLWPPHCVQQTYGAELHPRLQLRRVDHIVHKGSDVDAESYSGFADEHGKSSDLATLLRDMGVRRVFICGVALDYCVYYTALDALKENV